MLKRVPILFGAILAGACLLHFFVTGSLFPIFHVERLNNPGKVVGIAENQLILDGGSHTTLPFVEYVPSNNVMDACIARGVEVSGNGDIFALVKIWHWCGNDPVRFDLRRVNLSHIAIATDPDCIRSTEPAKEINALKARLAARQTSISKYDGGGWNINNLKSLHEVEAVLSKCSVNTNAVEVSL